MKQLIFMGSLLLASAMTDEAIANCAVGSGWFRTTDLVARLNGGLKLGKTACNASTTYDTCVKHPSPDCKPTVMGTQEEHHKNGELWDYKLGNSDPVDPRSKVGTWSVSNNNSKNATVTYNYVGGSSGTYAVYRNGLPTNPATLYDFCDSTSTSVGQFTLVPTSPNGASRVCP